MVARRVPFSMRCRPSAEHHWPASPRAIPSVLTFGDARARRFAKFSLTNPDGPFPQWFVGWERLVDGVLAGELLDLKKQDRIHRSGNVGRPICKNPS